VHLCRNKQKSFRPVESILYQSEGKEQNPESWKKNSSNNTERRNLVGHSGVARNAGALIPFEEKGSGFRFYLLRYYWFLPLKAFFHISLFSPLPYLLPPVVLFSLFPVASASAGA
jgi:hypothetical protein